MRPWFYPRGYNQNARTAQEKKAASSFPFTVSIDDGNFAKAVGGSKRPVVVLYTKGGKLVRYSGYELHSAMIGCQTVHSLIRVVYALTAAAGVRRRVRR